MSELWLNIRFGSRHLQIAPRRPWVQISYNDYHDKARLHEPEWRWFEVYECLWYRT